MVKNYICPIHGEFEHECKITDKELKLCPNCVTSRPTLSEDFEMIEYHKCNNPITRVFKPTGYSFHTDGFCGSGFSVPSYK